MLVHHVVPSSIASPPTLILLHGYGADEYDLIPVAQQLPPDFQIISIRAPLALPWGGYAWYHLYQTADGFRADDESRHQSQQLLRESIIQLSSEYDVTSESLTVLGFSQGAAMAYGLAVDADLNKKSLSPSRVIALSGYMPADVRDAFRRNKFFTSSFFLAHGSMDELIPITDFHIAEETLSSAKVSAACYEYLCGHTITQECISDMNRWLEGG